MKPLTWLWTLAGGLGAAGTLTAPASPRSEPPVPPTTAAPGSPEKTTPADLSPTDEPVRVQLVLSDGRLVEGRLIGQDDRSVTVEVNGIATPFQRGLVDRLRTLPSVSSEYARLKAAIDPRDIEARLRLAEWLRANERYDLALAEISEAMRIDPLHPEALEMKTLVEQQKMLADATKTRDDEPGTDASKPHRVVRRPEKPKFPVLSPEQVNVMRVYEVDLRRPPRMMIDRSTVVELMKTYSSNELIPQTPEGRDAFLRKDAVEILEVMFRLRAREFYGDVRVIENPLPFRLFREEVHRGWLMNSCATSRCHGGEDAGALYLNRNMANSDAAVYTNFLILDRFKSSDDLPLIDYVEPANSLLLQYGLPRALAKRKHPEIGQLRGRPAWKPVFESDRDPKFKAAVEWINTLYRPRPKYPVEYTPPLARPEHGDEDRTPR
ncbi:MAG: hypothetical protein AB7Q00_08510 [Phycisphaerales bacterium]